MDRKRFVLLASFGFLAGWMAYRAYLASNIFAALLTLFLASWIRGYGSNASIMFGTIGFLAGAGISMWIFKYWEI